MSKPIHDLLAAISTFREPPTEHAIHAALRTSSTETVHALLIRATETRLVASAWDATRQERHYRLLEQGAAVVSSGREPREPL